MSQDENIVWHAQTVSRKQKQQHKGHKPLLLWYTGLSGSGKSTVANAVEAKLFSLGCHTYLLDGDNVRMGLNKGLTFSDEDRVENIRRISEVAKLFVDAGLIVSTAFISPFKADRAQARSIVNEGEFVEVFIDTPLAVCESRDPKGLYKKRAQVKYQILQGLVQHLMCPKTLIYMLKRLTKPLSNVQIKL
ncbi:adenylyl-sulfate kinase [Pseudoalteromonas espejiana]